MGTPLRRVAAATAVAAAALAASTAAADAAISVSVGSPQLVAKGVAITVPVTVTCDPFSAGYVQNAAFLGVNVQQVASGKRLAYGSGSASTMGAPLAYTCDGVPQQTSVIVVASTTGAPFKRGVAGYTAFASASALPEGCDPYYSCWDQAENQSGSTTGTFKVR